MSDIKSLAHTKWNCKYHIVFAPKYRRQVFYGEKKRAIGEILRRLCEWKGLNTPPAKAGGFTVATKVAFRLKPVWPLLKQAEVIPPQFGRFHLHLPVA